MGDARVLRGAYRRRVGVETERWRCPLPDQGLVVRYPGWYCTISQPRTYIRTYLELYMTTAPAGPALCQSVFCMRRVGPRLGHLDSCVS